MSLKSKLVKHAPNFVKKRAAKYFLKKNQEFLFAAIFGFISLILMCTAMILNQLSTATFSGSVHCGWSSGVLGSYSTCQSSICGSARVRGSLWVAFGTASCIFSALGVAMLFKKRKYSWVVYLTAFVFQIAALFAWTTDNSLCFNAAFVLGNSLKIGTGAAASEFIAVGLAVVGQSKRKKSPSLLSSSR
jgi:hypothetical protein